MAFLEVAAFEELQEAKPAVVQAGGRDLVLMRWQNDVYALRNICPHMSTALLKGKVTSYVGGDTVGEIIFDHQNPIIACPWHHYEYSLMDGQCLTDVNLRIRSYPVRIEDGRVLVDLQGHRGGKRAATTKPALHM
jgi:nitrite reductase/ring-hydroxylating ferredoxin subunit